MDNIENDSAADVNDNFDSMDQDSPSNIEHVTALMTGIIMGRFGKSHNFPVQISSHQLLEIDDCK